MVEKILFPRLPPVPRRMILSYIANPTYAAWVEIRGISVAPGVSLWDVINSMKQNWGSLFPPTIMVARASHIADRRHKDMAALVM